jgi:hypothetical protein
LQREDFFAFRHAQIAIFNVARVHGLSATRPLPDGSARAAFPANRRLDVYAQRWNDGDLISSPCREKDKPALTCARIFQTFNRRDRRVNGMLCAKIVHRRFAGRHSIIVDDDKAA